MISKMICTSDFSEFWRHITDKRENNMEGKKSYCIYNPSIRYVQKVLEHTIINKGDIVSNTIVKEMYLICCIFKAYKVQLRLSCLDIWIKFQGIRKGKLWLGVWSP